MDSTRQEPPGVCSMSRSSLIRKFRALGDSAPGFVCWLEWFPWQWVTTEDNPSGQGIGGLSRCHGSMLFKSTRYRQAFLMALQVSPCLGCFQTSSQVGLGAEKLCLRNLLHAGGQGQAFIRCGDGSLWRSKGFLILPPTWLTPLYALILFSCTSVVLTPPPHGQTYSLQIDDIDFFFLSQCFLLENELFSWHPPQTSVPMGTLRKKHRPRRISTGSVSKLDSECQRLFVLYKYTGCLYMCAIWMMYEVYICIYLWDLWVVCMCVWAPANLH